MASGPEKTTVVCTNCSAKLAVPTAKLGRMLRCPRCQEPFRAATEAESVVMIDEDEESSVMIDEDEEPDEPGPKRRKKGSSSQRQELRDIATFQKGILVCILINLLTLGLQFALPADIRPLVAGTIFLVNGIVGTVFVFRLAIRLYSTGVGVLCGILTFIPCLGLIVLLIVNAKATSVLKKNGIRVGLLGANRSQI